MSVSPAEAAVERTSVDGAKLIGSAQIIVVAEVLAPFADVEGPEPVRLMPRML